MFEGFQGLAVRRGLGSVNCRSRSEGWYPRHGKRLLDVCLVVAALPFALPMMMVIAAVSRLLMGRPIIFRQRRPGLNGRPFEILKFRTMTEECGKGGSLFPDAQRLTRFGRFLRRTSLDELPELLNVLRGEMSIVGPRPLRMQYLPRYSPEQARRHDVKPGITGWAQVNGRNALTWEERFRLDVWYVDNHCFWLDVKIILMTLLKVIRREGISAEGHATMPEFTGRECG